MLKSTLETDRLVLHQRESTAVVHIRRRQSLFDIDWKAIFRSHELLLTLVYRDYSTRYKQTVLGPLWYVIQPLLTTIVFVIVFSRVAQIPTDGVPPILFYMCGMLSWNYFASVFSATSNVFRSNQQLFTKVYFPRVLMPIAATVSQLIGWSVQLGTFAFFFLIYLIFTTSGESLTFRFSMLWLPLLTLQAGLTALGAGFWISAMTAKYRDLTQLQPFLLQIWMYLTPLVYPLSSIPESYRWLAAINPMTMIVENTKLATLGVGIWAPGLIALSVGGALILFVSGLLKFQFAERTFVDNI